MKPAPFAFFIVPAPGHYGDRARVMSRHRTASGAWEALRRAGPGYVVRKGALRQRADWTRSMEAHYPIAVACYEVKS